MKVCIQLDSKVHAFNYYAILKVKGKTSKIHRSMAPGPLLCKSLIIMLKAGVGTDVCN